MIYKKNFISFYLTIIIFITSTSVIATENGNSITDIINKSESIETVQPFITDGSLDRLCAAYNVYSDSYNPSSIKYISEFILNSTPYKNESSLADAYAVACIAGFSDRNIIKKYLDNRYLIELFGYNQYDILTSKQKDEVIKNLSNLRPSNLENFGDRFRYILDDILKGGNGSAGSGSSADRYIELLNTDGTVPDNIIDNTMYTVKYINTSDNEYDEMVILFAVYDTYGKLKNLCNKKYIKYSEEYSENFILNSTDTIKVICLESFENISPLFEPTVIDLQSSENNVITK